MTAPAEEECCPHAFGRHAVVALHAEEVAGVPDVPVSGVLLCPECPCTATWSLEARYRGGVAGP